MIKNLLTDAPTLIVDRSPIEDRELIIDQTSKNACRENVGLTRSGVQAEISATGKKRARSAVMASAEA